MKAKWVQSDGQVFHKVDYGTMGAVAYLAITMEPWEASTPEAFRMRLVDALLGAGTPDAVQDIILRSSMVAKELSKK